MAFSARLLYAALKNIIGMLWNPGADFWKELSAEKKNIKLKPFLKTSEGFVPENWSLFIYFVVQHL